MSWEQEWNEREPLNICSIENTGMNDCLLVNNGNLERTYQKKEKRVENSYIQ